MPWLWLQAEDGLCQLQIVGDQVRRLLADVQQGGFQSHATDVALAGDEAGGIVTGSEHYLVIAQRRGDVGGGIRGGTYGADHGVSGDYETGGRGSGGEGQQGGKAE
ncbi:hypothetical protein D3C86_1919650 [compost metagenome]